MGERWYRSALCWPHFWTIWTVRVLHTSSTPRKLGLCLPSPVPDPPAATVGTAPAAIRASPQAAWSAVSAGSQSQRSRRDGEARTETIVSQRLALRTWVGGWVVQAPLSRLPSVAAETWHGVPGAFGYVPNSIGGNVHPLLLCSKRRENQRCGERGAEEEHEEESLP